ncbi:MAG TPA: hypothetical protein VF589_10835 [Allosphingosinicella sp.]
MSMPRFYFHVCNGNGFTEDSGGKVLPDLPAARQEAITSLRSILAADMNMGHVNMSSFIEIEDDEHRLMMTIQFMDAIEISTERCSRVRA